MVPRLIFALLLALVALAPFPFGANRMWAWGLLAVTGSVLVLAMAAAAAANAANLTMPWRHYRVLAGGYLLVLAWMAVQASPWVPSALHHPLWAQAAATLGQPLGGAISLDPAASLAEAAKFTAYGCAFWLALQFAGRDHRARLILWTVLLAAFANAVYGLAVRVTGSETVLWYDKWSYRGMVTGTFVNRNHFATYTGIALVVGFGFLLEELRRVSAGLSLRTLAGLLGVSEAVNAKLIALGVIVSTLALALILSGSRGALLASGAGIAAFLAGAALARRISRARIARFALVLAGLGVVAVAVNGRTAIERLSQAGANFAERFTVYKATAAAILERPVLGTGGGTFENVFLAHRPESLWVTLERYDYAHNTYLEFGLEHGLVALAIMLAMAALLMHRYVAGARTRRRNDVFPAIGIGATTLVAGHALIDFSLEIPAVAVTYLVVAATAYAQSFSHSARDIRSRAAATNDGAVKTPADNRA